MKKQAELARPSGRQAAARLSRWHRQPRRHRTGPPDSRRDRAEFLGPASAAVEVRSADRGRPLLFLLRGALHRRPARPASTSRASSSRSGATTSKARPYAILSENIMGGMCARVCPTEVLCEEACVRNVHEDKPVDIGLLQRHATDPVLASGKQLFERAKPSGNRVAVVGGGPAALSCAHRLAWLGHEVTILSRDGKLGGLNEYGIAAYKTVDDFAQLEVAYILGIGGIEVRTGVALGRELSLAKLCREFDAVFLAVGLAGVNELGLESENLPGVIDAVRLHRRAPPGSRQDAAAGRAADRRHRWRHDCDRRGRAEQAARRRGRHDRVPPRPGPDGREPLRAGSRAERRRAHPALGKTDAPGRQGLRDARRVRMHARGRRTDASRARARPSR